MPRSRHDSVSSPAWRRFAGISRMRRPGRPRARRDRHRSPALRSRAGHDSRSLGARLRPRSRTGRSSRLLSRRSRVRPLHRRLAGARRRHRPNVREHGIVPARARHGATGAVGAERPGAARRRDPAPVPRMVMQLLAVWATMQAFGIDAAFPAAGLVLVLMNVATIVPLWPGNVGPGAGRRCGSAQELRGAVRDRFRLRARVAGDRDGLRGRARAARTRPGGHLARRAAAHEDDEGESAENAVEVRSRDGRRDRGGVGARVGAEAALRPLLSPASLKGVSRRHGPRLLSPEAPRAAGWEATELPVADGGEGTTEVLRSRSAESGARRSFPTRSGVRSRRAGSSCPTGERSSRRRRRSGCLCSTSRSSTRCGRRAAGSASSFSPRWTRGPPRWS